MSDTLTPSAKKLRELLDEYDVSRGWAVYRWVNDHANDYNNLRALLQEIEDQAAKLESAGYGIKLARDEREADRRLIEEQAAVIQRVRDLPRTRFGAWPGDPVMVSAKDLDAALARPKEPANEAHPPRKRRVLVCGCTVPGAPCASES